MARNIYGGGAKTNRNGLNFEQETSLKNALIEAGYIVNAQNMVFDFQGNNIALLAPKNRLYEDVLEPEGICWKDYISKKLLPDEALLNYENNTIYIIEKKFQNCSGSVDEKLQTCDFKKKQYKKLFRDTDYYVEYLYVCNDWFRQPCYDDVYEYIHSVGCEIFFNRIPLDYLGLPY